MSSWEKILKDHQQQEAYRKNCYQRLQQWKKERREAKELEKDLHEMLSSFHLQSSGFREG
jgi:hypothetical protein